MKLPEVNRLGVGLTSHPCLAPRSSMGTSVTLPLLCACLALTGQLYPCKSMRTEWPATLVTLHTDAVNWVGVFCSVQL